MQFMIIKLVLDVLILTLWSFILSLSCDFRLSMFVHVCVHVVFNTVSIILMLSSPELLLSFVL